MFNTLKTFCKNIVPLTETELLLIDTHFELRKLNKKDYLLKDGMVFHFIGFIASGAIRHFHIKDGLEKTCDISFEHAWVTDFQSFTHSTSGIINLQAMEDATVCIIKKENLYKLYKACSKYETFGRLMAEQVAQRKGPRKWLCRSHPISRKNDFKIC